MKQQVIIIGAGGHSAELDDYFAHAQKKDAAFGLQISGFIDDNADSYKKYPFSAPFLGSIKNHQVDTNVQYLMGIANLTYRRPIIEHFLTSGAKFATFIHPDAYLSKSCTIAEGVVISPSVNIGPNVSVGSFTLINSRCSLGHDTVVGSFNFLCPNVCFSGFTQIAEDNLFGINSCTIPGITVGSRNKIAAGMVLDKNVGSDEVVFYRFKEKVLAIPKIL
jgi:sugar O-acyltransferase (sialic acid O-acetyltransferase NeuD family)